MTALKRNVPIASWFYVEISCTHADSFTSALNFCNPMSVQVLSLCIQYNIHLELLSLLVSRSIYKGISLLIFPAVSQKNKTKYLTFGANKHSWTFLYIAFFDRSTCSQRSKESLFVSSLHFPFCPCILFHLLKFYRISHYSLGQV